MTTRTIHSIHQIFNDVSIRDAFFKFRYGLVFCAFLFLVSQVRSSWFLPGFLVAFCGELIQIWCFAVLEKNTRLTTKGPYMFVRNPMYIGRFFLVLGCLLLTGHVRGVPILIPLYYFYAVNRTKREETRLLALHGETYLRYCRKVNRFLPGLKGFEKDSLFHFKWDLLMVNHGLHNLSAMLTCFFVLYLASQR
ncbi:MAG: isoprenylcysteine carboxylmethyltransferase family protein [Deltaproteobacteria bacterium]|nr:isoprenylcysteine carboxylmethyltransferase family protein [Deltaproteobacteria bacterium]